MTVRRLLTAAVVMLMLALVATPALAEDTLYVPDQSTWKTRLEYLAQVHNDVNYHLLLNHGIDDIAVNRNWGNHTCGGMNTAIGRRAQRVAACVLVDLGVTDLFPDGALKPLEIVGRGEAAVIAMRVPEVIEAQFGDVYDAYPQVIEPYPPIIGGSYLCGFGDCDDLAESTPFDAAEQTRAVAFHAQDGMRAFQQPGEPMHHAWHHRDHLEPVDTWWTTTWHTGYPFNPAAPLWHPDQGMNYPFDTWWDYHWLLRCVPGMGCQ